MYLIDFLQCLGRTHLLRVPVCFSAHQVNTSFRKERIWLMDTINSKNLVILSNDFTNIQLRCIEQ